jgi:PleD family two-component response regulator
MVHHRVLIAEDGRSDNGLLYAMLQPFLPPAGLAIARTREEFARRVETESFDCVVLDTALGDSTADELIALLRRRRSDCPAIIVSRDADRGVALRAVRRGAVEVMGRDEAATGDTLLERISAAVDAVRRGQRDRRRRQRREHRPTESAERDPETGLVSRATIERMFSHADRRVLDRRGFTTVLLMELDRPSAMHGNTFSTETMRQVAEAFRQGCATCDATCRWSETTLLALRPETPFARAIFHAEQLRRRIAGLAIQVDGRRIGLTACVGLATVRSDAFGSGTIDRAAGALAAARQTGTDRVWSAERAHAEELLRSTPAGEVPTRVEALLHALSGRFDGLRRDRILRSAARTADVAAELAAGMRLDARTVERVRLAGRCLELGGLCAPPDGASGGSIPAPEQRHLEAKLADDAAALAASLGADRETTTCIRLHHVPFCEMERDGHGGSGHIPLGARIVRVAQALVAMTSDRSAHSRTALDLARQTLRQESGRLFDPAVVEAAVGLDIAASEDLFLRMLERSEPQPEPAAPPTVSSAGV